MPTILTKLIGSSNVAGPTTGSLAGTFGLQPLIGKSLAIISDARFTGQDIGTVVERLLCISGEDTLGIFDRDIAAAGIAKHDDRGRSLDVHALRHTFGTHLSKAGVPPRVAQAAMRHSSLHLTMNIYTDPTLLDVAGAINALPTFASESPISAQIGA